jgi:transposase-like protein
MSTENRKYTHIQVFKTEILTMREEGATFREIAEHYGFKDKYVVKKFLIRERRKQRQLDAGLLPRKRGRPARGGKPDLEQENKRLRMENELLRDFMHVAGRR